jgi:hypothetical protein
LFVAACLCIFGDYFWPPSAKVTTKHPKTVVSQETPPVEKKVPASPSESIRQKEVPKKETTFKEVLGPFVVIAGSNTNEIPASASKNHPVPALMWKIGDVKDFASAYIEDGRLYVDTSLYSGPSLPPVEIKDNNFIVRPTNWDRNFDDTALEIVDENLLPRLQLIYKNPHTVILNGIFVFHSDSGKTGVMIIDEERMTLNPSEPITPNLRRIFKYPSRHYLGQELEEPHL